MDYTKCLVFELLGPTVAQVEGFLVSASVPLPETILRMSEQPLEAIKFIHDTGMGHGGNVTLYRLLSVFHIYPLNFVTM